MIVLSVTATLLLTAGVAIGLWNLLRAARLDRAPAPITFPRVSLLIPARNEAEKLPHTLPALLALDHADLEVILLDDESWDGTAELIDDAVRRGGGRLRLVKGSPPPAGWLGKNWACAQLAEEASGDLLIFCDADVVPAAEAVTRTVGAMDAYGAGALTALVRQATPFWGAAAVVPLAVHLPVLAMLPLPLVPRVPSPALAMGNGQWFGFRREVYELIGGHAAVRSEVVEDLALARRVKAAGGRLLPVVARDLLVARSYGSLAELREGFGKNLYPLLGRTPPSLAVGLAVFLLMAVYPWVAALLGATGAAVPLLLLVMLRLEGAALFGHGFASIVLHPVGSVQVALIALESFARHRRKSATWKGRRTSIGQPPPDG